MMRTTSTRHSRRCGRYASGFLLPPATSQQQAHSCLCMCGGARTGEHQRNPCQDQVHPGSDGQRGIDSGRASGVSFGAERARHGRHRREHAARELLALRRGGLEQLDRRHGARSRHELVAEARTGLESLEHGSGARERASAAAARPQDPAQIAPVELVHGLDAALSLDARRRAPATYVAQEANGPRRAARRLRAQHGRRLRPGVRQRCQRRNSIARRLAQQEWLALLEPRAIGAARRDPRAPADRRAPLLAAPSAAARDQRARAVYLLEGSVGLALPRQLSRLATGHVLVSRRPTWPRAHCTCNDQPATAKSERARVTSY